MNFNKLVVLSLFTVLVTFAFATSSVAQDISTKQWRVFNINPDAPKLWDINKAQSLDPSGVGFNFNLLSSGWFTVYLNTNYGELTGKSAISANRSVVMSLTLPASPLSPSARHTGKQFTVFT